ncbi:MAG: ABC transporter permease [Gordonia sp. (in: high G+C Gram-positive bacteria)]|uniref:ABC transporter permease n=1 Tax=Gordonia sp. (in: high G+C Gram-positive bacteria) TaxID=84139 RepID=UPI0039E5452B
MSGSTVGWLGLGISLIFLAAATLLAAAQRLQMSRTIVVAVGRSLVQMAVVAAALVPIVNPKTPMIWSWLWVALIIGFASVTVVRRVPHVPGLLTVSLLAHLVVAVISLAIVFGFQIFALDGRSLVPVSGMVIGGAMKAAVVAATRVAEVTSEHRDEIEAGLALGMSVPGASRRLVRQSLRTAISPQLEQIAGLGIVFLPGAMTGMILAGVAPWDAVRTQLALMYVMFAGVVIAALITGLGTLRGLTTDRQTVVQLARS